MMTFQKYFLCTAIFWGLFLSQQAYATTIADGSIAFSNLKINPTTGMVQFLDSWGAETFAQASNSSGELKADFQNSSGGSADANAAVTFGMAHASADAGKITGNANSHVEMPAAVNQQVITKGTVTLFNSFMITGVAGKIPVDFSVDLIPNLSILPDPNALPVSTDITFSLAIDGTSVLFDHQSLSLGSNVQSIPQPALTITASGDVEGNMMHDITATVDAEGGPSKIPEPASFALMLTGFGLMAALFARRSLG